MKKKQTAEKFVWQDKATYAKQFSHAERVAYMKGKKKGYDTAVSQKAAHKTAYTDALSDVMLVVNNMAIKKLDEAFIEKTERWEKSAKEIKLKKK